MIINYLEIMVKMSKKANTKGLTEKETNMYNKLLEWFKNDKEKN